MIPRKDVYAVIGNPIAHSLSPAMHNAAFRALGMEAEYVAVRVEPDQLEGFAKQARRQLRGFNVTVPHKHAIIPFLDEIAPEAAMAESVNTVIVRNDGSLYGTSTDGVGLERSVKEAFDLDLTNLPVCFLGCGGVVLALATHCCYSGAKAIRILNRTVSKANDLCSKLADRFPGVAFEAGDIADTNAVSRFLAVSELVVQCTSLGLKPDDPAPVDPGLLPQRICLFETIYKPTRLFAAAQTMKINACNGAPMLLYQGAESFRLWTGVMPPLDVMRAALPASR